MNDDEIIRNIDVPDLDYHYREYERKMNTAKIIAYTNPFIKIYDKEDNEESFRLMGVDEFIAYVARVSNPSNQNNTLTAPKLLRYLAKHKHWSPFEMVDVVMEINTTRDIGRQILRHRSFTFQEFSQRYADPTKDMGFVHREARLQDTKNRQNSIETDDENIKTSWERKQQTFVDKANDLYVWAIENGIAKEQARAVLPEGLTESVMIMSGSLRSWVHYCQLRMDKATQKEHRIVAEQCWNIIAHHFPDVKLALDSMAAQAEFERKLP
jgi:thymidylate synthase (FAD)